MRILPIIAVLGAVLCACKGSSSDKPAAKAPPPETAPEAVPSEPAPPPEPASPTAPATDLARGANQFALKLWAHVPAGNMAVSPASIAIPLAIVWGGAKGATAAQLGSLLQLQGPPDVVLSRWGNLAKSLVDPARPLTLKLANRLYAEKTYNVDTTYFTVVRHAMDAWIEPVDFVGSADDVRKKINTWVAEKTADRIKDLLPARSVNAATKLVIVNAIYFLADWATPFDKAATKPADFHVTGATKRQVPTMSTQQRLRYASANGAALVELPYKEATAAMYVIVPDARDGLAALEKQLEVTLKALQNKLAPQMVNLALPRFTIDPSTPLMLDTALQALGAKDMFDAVKAELSGIARPSDPRQKLFLSSVIHTAFVTVDEQGTEAAAATAVTAVAGGPPPTPIEVRADHPFMFVIVDRASGLILFMGRVVDPK